MLFLCGQKTKNIMVLKYIFKRFWTCLCS